MYLFQPEYRCSLDVLATFIYIPLCIYFNPKEISAGLSGYNLHSTMYLFQLAMSSYLDFWIDFIYIPLCIYFNYRKESRIPDCIKFTFHYVSISTYFLCLKYNITSLFTFHYVSISTVTVGASFFIIDNLHSTMYLFQLSRCWMILQILLHLHSTMYLFQRWITYPYLSR